MLADLSVPWVILGHSERRHIIGESDAMTADKVRFRMHRATQAFPIYLLPS